MRSLSFVALSLILCSGCITAPVGFYESAFSHNTPFYGGIAGEWGRNYEDIPTDTGQFSYMEPREIVDLYWFSYSPVPKLSLGAEMTNTANGPYGGLRGKLNLLDNGIFALAGACRGGGGWGSYVGFAWPWPVSNYEAITRYRIYNLAAAGILSFSLLGSWRKGLGELPIRASVNAGPKFLLTWLDYTRIENWYYEGTIYSDTCRFNGDIRDYGWFLGANAEIGVFAIAYELSFLSTESPLRHERAWTRFWGISLGGTF